MANFGISVFDFLGEVTLDGVVVCDVVTATWRVFVVEVSVESEDFVSVKECPQEWQNLAFSFCSIPHFEQNITPWELEGGGSSVDGTVKLALQAGHSMV
jgi:hypothetical protein